MTKQNRNYNEKFIKYQKFIIKHAAYKGMPMPSYKVKIFHGLLLPRVHLVKLEKSGGIKKKLNCRIKTFC